MTYLNVSVKPPLRCISHCLLHNGEGCSSSTNGAKDFTAGASYRFLSLIHPCYLEHKSTRDTGQEATLAFALVSRRASMQLFKGLPNECNVMSL